MVQLGEEGSGFTVQFSVGCWEHPAKMAGLAEEWGSYGVALESQAEYPP